MAHIQFELDAIGSAHMVAGLIGIPPPQVTGGLCELWAWCWREKTTTVTALQVAGIFFCNHPTLIDALTAGGFIESADGSLRVRGAEKYLRIADAQRKAATETNKKRSLEREGSDGTPNGIATLPPPETDALTPITDHRSPITDQKPKALSLRDRLCTDAQEVFEYWRQTLRPNARVFDAKTRKVVEARLSEKPTPFTVEDLKQAIDGCKASPHHMGQNDNHKRYDSLELICRDGAKVHSMQGYLEKGRKLLKPGFQDVSDSYRNDPNIPPEDLWKTQLPPVK